MAARFDHILVANRGEIAVRVLRSANRLGYRTTAVYSEADAGAPHVAAADQAYLLGPGPASESYLDVERLLRAAEATGAGAIHPGYGFLSENAGFAEACAAHGVVFIGPSAEVIDLMGNKARAKEHMIRAGVPCVPGYQGAQDTPSLRHAASEIGYPLMIKAAAGGGGRGMRLVANDKDFVAALQTARSEAARAFGSEEVILEKAILRPRHVEVQVLADEHGNVVHLGERDCSVQRRHQKIIEEAPSPALDPATREAMTAAAVEAARAVGYLNAGTVEFILDQERNFYFLEMNTRLQVEHPVTEAVTGLDLVAEQLAVAQGEPLSFEQSDVVTTGHAIEVRVYAEDPSADFLPSTGRIHAWSPPDLAGVRVDSGIVEGQVISPFYDPMMAKIIAHGADRGEALTLIDAALQQTALLGPATNLWFLRQCLASDTFVQGLATTDLIAEEYGTGSIARELSPPGTLAIAAALFHHGDTERSLSGAAAVSSALRGWASNGSATLRLELTDAETRHAVELTQHGAERFTAVIDGTSVSVDLGHVEDGRATARTDLVRRDVTFRFPSPFDLHLQVDGLAHRFQRPNPLNAAEGEEGAETHVRAPMHGSVTAVFVEEGDRVSRGERLMVLEAMKMQHEIKSTVSGTVQRMLVRVGAQMAMGSLMVELQPEQA